MSKIVIPENYKPHLSLIETEVAIKMIKDNKQVVACGNHKYDSNLFKYANYSFTIDNAPINLKNESNKVLNTNNNEKIFNELGHLYHKKTY